jgi:hypothetical protein
MHSQLENPSDALSNREVALDLASRNFAVFPLCDWNRDGNWRPIRGWQTGASSDPIVIADWFRQWPDARLGLPAGEHNRISVIDVDVKGGKDGVASLAALGFPDIEAMTPVRVRTPSGGWHLYFRYDPRLKNTVSKIGDGLDVRTERGLVMAPGSFKDGHQYQSVDAPLGSVELPDFPESLIPLPPPERGRVEIVTDATEDQREWATSYLTKLADTLADIGEGARHDTLNSAAYWAGGAAAHGFLTYGQVETVLLATAKACGLPDDEAEGTIEAAYYDGLDDPISGFPMVIDDDDFNDLPPIDESGESATDGETDLPANGWDCLSTNDCAAERPRQYVVKGMMAEGDHACIFGAPGAGKSLIAPHIAFAVACGERAFGMRTRKGKVLYIAAEDPYGMAQRVRALRRRRGDDAGNFLLLRRKRGTVDLLTKGGKQVAELLAAVKAQRPVLVVIDTLASAFPGLEENDAASMGRVNAVARQIAACGPAVILVHHDAKSGAPTPRGHSIYNGDLDVGLHMNPRDQSGVVRAQLTKNRNGGIDRPIFFTIDVERFGFDEDGDPVEAPIVAEQATSGVPRRASLSLSQQAAVSVLECLVDASESVTDAQWLKACVDGCVVSGAEKQADRRRVFNAARFALITKGVVLANNGMVGLVGAVAFAGNDNDDLDEEEDMIG